MLLQTLEQGHSSQPVARLTPSCIDHNASRSSICSCGFPLQPPSLGAPLLLLHRHTSPAMTLPGGWTFPQSATWGTSGLCSVRSQMVFKLLHYLNLCKVTKGAKTLWRLWIRKTNAVLWRTSWDSYGQGSRAQRVSQLNQLERKCAFSLWQTVAWEESRCCRFYDS